MADPVVLGEAPVVSRVRRGAGGSSSRNVRLRALRGFNPPDLVAVPAAFVVGVLVCLARCPSTILHPELWAEDGAVWFKNAYEQGWFFPLVHTYNGYLQTLSRLVADVGLLVPLRRLPVLFVLTALVIQVLPAVFVISRRCAVLVPNFAVRVLLAALYLAVPNASEINVNLTNAQWHLGLLAVLVVLAREPVRAWKVFDVIVIALCGLTGPFILALLPVALFIWMRRRTRWSIATLGLTAGFSVVELVALGLTSQSSRHFGPLGVTAHRLIEILGGQVVGGTVLGSSSLLSPTSSHYFVESAGFLVAGLALVAVVLWRAPLELKLFNLFVGLVLTAFLVSPVVTVTGSQWQVLATTFQLRYWFFPALLVLADLVWLAGQIRVSRRLLSVVGSAVLVASILIGVRIDFRDPPLPKPNWAAQVKAFDATPKGHLFHFVIDPPGFPMALIKK